MRGVGDVLVGREVRSRRSIGMSCMDLSDSGN